MKFNREQQRELKKISVAFDSLKDFSDKEGYPLDALVPDLVAPNLHELQHDQLQMRNQSRQEVFKQSRKKTEKSTVKS
jgi:hypothetical protein